METSQASSRFAEVFQSTPVIAILRGVENQNLEPLVRGLVEGGIRLIEVSFSDERGRETYRRLSERWSSWSLPDTCMMGAGTVTRVQQVDLAADRGAAYVVTPHVVPTVFDRARERGIEVVGGAFTPTEVQAVVGQDVDYVKIFPASVGGPGHIGALLGPYPELNLIPVGGVHGGNAEAFMQAGAFGLGLGSYFTDACGSQDVQRAARVRAEELLEDIQPHV